MTILIIASPFRSSLSQEANLERLIKAQSLIQQYTIALPQQTIGSFREEGKESFSSEVGLMFPIEENSLSGVINLFCDVFNQDCILAINPNTMLSGLIYKDYSCTELGYFQPVTREEAKKSGCFTYWQGKYFICK